MDEQQPKPESYSIRIKYWILLYFRTCFRILTHCRRLEMEIATSLGCFVGFAFGGLVFVAYKLGLLYQLFHKVSPFGVNNVTF